jgi:hypothetical protein
MVDVPLFEIEVVYQSGQRQRFWVYSFSYSKSGCTWRYAEGPRPIHLGADQIESIWQHSTKTVQVAEEVAERLKDE